MKLNGITHPKFARKALYTLLGIASAVLITACGGSVDVVYDNSPGPGPGAQHVTDALAQRASATSLTGGPISLYAPAGALLDAVSTLLDPNNNLYTTQTLDLSPVCNAPGGSLIMQTVDAGNDQRFTPGDSASMSFSNCRLSADGLNITLNGSLSMSVQTSTRGIDTAVTYYFSPQNLTGMLGATAASYSGLAGIEYVFPGGNPNALPNIAYVSDRIALTFAGTRSDIVTQMRWPVIIGGTTSTPLTTLYPSHILTLNEFGYTDVFNTSTLSPVQYQGGAVKAFTTGQLRHDHALDRVTTTVTATNQMQSDIDFYADGTTERIITDTVSGLINSFH